MHTLNDQVFRGFFTGRYLFDSVTGFLRYASPAAPGGFGPYTIGCSNGTTVVAYVTAPAVCPAGTTPSGGPLLLYLQGAGLSGPATDATGASKITNDEFSLFVQDKWQPRANLTINYGLRWDAQRMPDTVDPSTTAFAAFLSDPAFPIGRHHPEPMEHVAAARRGRVGRSRRRPVRRPRERRRVLRAAEHAEPGRDRHDQRRAAADDRSRYRSRPASRRCRCGPEW